MFQWVCSSEYVPVSMFQWDDFQSPPKSFRRDWKFENFLQSLFVLCNVCVCVCATSVCHLKFARLFRIWLHLGATFILNYGRIHTLLPVSSADTFLCFPWVSKSTYLFAFFIAPIFARLHLMLSVFIADSFFAVYCWCFRVFCAWPHRYSYLRRGLAIKRIHPSPLICKPLCKVERPWLSYLGLSRGGELRGLWEGARTVEPLAGGGEWTTWDNLKFDFLFA